jgi:hypothetical protein
MEKSAPNHPSACRIAAHFAICALGLLAMLAAESRAQNEPPILVPDVVDYSKLLPILPDAPSGWTADKAEGSTTDVGGFQITNVHRDYRKGEGANAPTASISILDSVANPDYVQATTAAWNQNSETPEGYSKSVTIDGNPGFEAYEKDQHSTSEAPGAKAGSPTATPSPSPPHGHASLWVMIGKRYFVEIELQNQDPKELQEWAKRIDLKQLATTK